MFWPPRNVEAEEEYRAAFARWSVVRNDPKRVAERQMLEREMDLAQERIAINPEDPRWKAFKATLPEEFHRFWGNFAEWLALPRSEEN